MDDGTDGWKASGEADQMDGFKGNFIRMASGEALFGRLHCSFNITNVFIKMSSKEREKESGGKV
jgi:hypothetical protein